MEEHLRTLITIFNNADNITDITLQKLFRVTTATDGYLRIAAVTLLIGVGSVLMLHLGQQVGVLPRPGWRAQG